MMLNRPRPFESASQLSRVDDMPSDHVPDGPIALLRALVAFVLRNKYSLAAAAAAGIALASFYAHSLPPIYRSTATLLLEPRQMAAPGQGLQQSMDLNRVDSELAAIRSERLLSAVFKSLNLGNSPELGPQPPGMIDQIVSGLRNFPDLLLGSAGPAKHDRSLPAPSLDKPQAVEIEMLSAFRNFANRLNARRVGQSFVIEIEYSSTYQALPARVANAVVSGYILQTIAFKEQTARMGTEVLQGRLDALAAQVDAAQNAMRNGSLPSIPTPDADLRIIGAALPPLGPSAPRATLIMALGGVLGLLGGIGAIGLQMVFDRKVRTATQLTRDTGIICLGSIPNVPGNAGVPRHVSSPQDYKFFAAIHDLRTSVEIACNALRSDQSVVIAIVGWTRGVGVSTLCLSLAQLIRRSGRHVTLFQASGTAVRLGANQVHARPTGSLADAAFAGLGPAQLGFGEIDGIELLPIHSANANANIFADFHNLHVESIMDAARSKGDVLLDLPSLDSSMDALALAAYADAVLVVARAGQTTVDELAESFQLLRRAGVNVIGTVINRVKPP